MASSLLHVAEKYASGKIAFLLEGGYNLIALKSSVASVLHVMAGGDKSELPSKTGRAKIETLIVKILDIQEKYH